MAAVWRISGMAAIVCGLTFAIGRSETVLTAQVASAQPTAPVVPTAPSAGAPSDEELQPLRAAAEHGAPDAQYQLGVVYARGAGVEQSYAQAFEWWRKAADQGFGSAQYAIGLLYRDGLGVARDVPPPVAVRKFTFSKFT